MTLFGLIMACSPLIKLLTHKQDWSLVLSSHKIDDRQTEMILLSEIIVYIGIFEANNQG